MFLCYIDESGTAECPGTTSHFVLAGFVIPVWKWRMCDTAIRSVKTKYDLDDAEIHTGWLLRRYAEQDEIPGFDRMNFETRRREMRGLRIKKILAAQRSQNHKQMKKNFEQTKNYTHLTYQQRKDFLREIAEMVRSWRFARLFADCIDKTYYDAERHRLPVGEQALEQIVSRFHRFLEGRNRNEEKDVYGMLIHDNNQTIAKRHTKLMQGFHQRGTFWTSVQYIIETPLFVDSSLTSMVQIADLCAYAIRRYVENGEEELLDVLIPRAQISKGKAVGIRHFSIDMCSCKICTAHGKRSPLFQTPPITTIDVQPPNPKN